MRPLAHSLPLKLTVVAVAWSIVDTSVGSLLPGDKVVITEDAVTRGTSPIEAALVARELGAEPVMILPVVDRGGTCGDMAENEGIAFRPLVTAPDLGFPYEKDA